jgi:thiol-disulfide isomerase/thioredoxin
MNHLSRSLPKVIPFFALLLSLSPVARAQEDKMAIIRGRIATARVPDEISLNLVKNGEPVLHSKVKVAPDGTFGFIFQPDAAGLFTVGERGQAARLYLSPGRSIRLTLEDGGFSVNPEDKENTLLAAWSKKIWELKKCNQMQGLFTYKEIFPKFPDYEKAVTEMLASPKSGNAEFDALFAKLVPAEFEYELYHFLFMPRTMHPKAEDYPELYQKLSAAPHFTDDSVLRYDFGMAYVYAYIMFRHTTDPDKTKKGADVMAERGVQLIPNPMVRGWYLVKNALTKSKAYDDPYIAKLEKYRPQLVTDEQRKVVSDFILTINKTAAGEPFLPFEGSTPDGKQVTLADFKDKVVVIDVWATWCGPCKKEIPHLKQLEEAMKGQDVVFLSYSVDETNDLEKWKKMVRDETLGGVQLIGPTGFKSPICENYKITSIPRFIVIDKKGNIVSLDAPRPSSPELKALLEKQLKL